MMTSLPFELKCMSSPGNDVRPNALEVRDKVNISCNEGRNADTICDTLHACGEALYVARQ
jgi:hypothetical protein